MSNQSLKFYKKLGIIKNSFSKNFKIPKMEDNDIIILNVVESNDNDVIYLYTKKVESIGKFLTN